MTTKEITHQYRIGRWTALTKERAELGMSIRAYCAMKGFAENTYFYWQRRLRESARTQMESEGANLPVAGFTQVALMPTPEVRAAQSEAGHLQVQINGILLNADSNYPSDKLAVLIRELVQS